MAAEALARHHDGNVDLDIRNPAVGLWNWLTQLLMGVSEDPVIDRPGSTPAPAATAGATATATLDPQDQASDTDGAAPWWAPGTDPPPDEAPTLCTEARALENILVSHFDGHDLDIPPLPHVAQQVLARLRNRECSFKAVADEISQDQVMAAAVLRMANSPLFRGMQRINQLPAAVTRVGRNALRMLMMHQSLHAAVFYSKEADRNLVDLIWDRAVISAWIARDLAQFVKMDPEDAFLLGLLHDIGNVMVLRLTSRTERATGFQIDTPTFEHFCQQCHQEFGELIAEAWQLPPGPAALIADHHQPPADDDPLRTDRLLLQLTDLVVAQLGYAPGGASDLLDSRPVIDLGLADRPDFVTFLNRLPEQLTENLNSI